MNITIRAIFERSFPAIGLPNPIKDKNFRHILLKALNAIDEEEETKETETEETEETEKETFVFSEKIYKRQLELLDAGITSTRNRAADWILTAWEKGYINVKS